LGHAERLTALTLIEPYAERPQPITLGADKGYDTADFVIELREEAVAPHVAQNQNGRRSAIDGRTTRHATTSRSSPRLPDGAGPTSRTRQYPEYREAPSSVSE
jgi:hypothetical protein